MNVERIFQLDSLFLPRFLRRLSRQTIDEYFCYLNILFTYILADGRLT